MRVAPFLRRIQPALIIIPIVAVAAGLFAGSYSYSLAHPAPHRLAVATVADGGTATRFIAQLDKELGTRLAVTSYTSAHAATGAVDAQRVFAVIRPEGSSNQAVQLEVVPAAGAYVARLLTGAAPQAAKTAGVALTITQSHPLQSSDPQGLAVFYISLAAVVLGFVGAAQLTAHAGALRLGERFAAIGCYAALGALAIVATVDWGLHVIDLPFGESWAILALTMATCGLVFTAFHVLIGPWAILPTWVLLVMLGNPSSGGAVSAPLLPEPMRAVGRWLPPGASVGAQHTAIYFRGHQSATPFLTLAVWATVAATTAWATRNHRLRASAAD